ncbi:MAG: DNA primase [Chloroflexota bacterium]|nr:DNA primase [Chloroflexota bacterium]
MSEIEEIKARLDIADVVGQHVQLHKAGRTLKGLCPFHAEKTPSFIVSPDRQTWHCFGSCGTGGDVISFVMKNDGLDFGDALRLLAERTGVKLKERRVSEEQDRATRRLYDVNEVAADYFQRLLATEVGNAARAYVERRGIDETTARSFQLGYSVPGWGDCIEHLRGQRFTDREIIGAGLALQGDKGLHDRFRNRLMFPVWEAKGRLIGFGARALDDSMPKYLNTAQTPLFDKGGTLYALNKAGEAIRRDARAVIVEGYMDVIAAHQHGFENVVAQMGTALTERQVQLLKRLAPVIVLALDSDAAGNLASVRGDDVIKEALTGDAVTQSFNWRGLVIYQDTTGVDLRVATIPEGKDPDDFVRADPEAWRALIEAARPVLEFRLEVAAAAHDLTDPRGRSQMVQEYLPLLSAVADPVVRAHYLQRLSRLAQVSEEELKSLVVRPRGRQEAVRPSPIAPARGPARVAGREAFPLALLLQHPELRRQGLAMPEELLWDAEARQVLEIWRENESTDLLKSAIPPELMDYFERLILWKIPHYAESEAAEALEDCIKRLNRRRLEAEQQANSAQVADLQDEMGTALISSALTEGSIGDVSPELQETLLHGEEIGNELHRRKSKDGRAVVETGVDG